MDSRRRLFLRSGMMAAFCAALPLKFSGLAAFGRGTETSRERWGNGQISAASMRDPVYYLTVDSLSPYVGTQFSFSLNRFKTARMKLVEVEDLRPAAVKESTIVGKDCFSILFQGPSSLPLKQDSYRLKHPALGEFSLLVTPVYSKRRGLFYEAIINRLYS
jgi:hypothetical protein